jgi:hypothetical protein
MKELASYSVGMSGVPYTLCLNLKISEGENFLMNWFDYYASNCIFEYCMKYILVNLALCTV